MEIAWSHHKVLGDMNFGSRFASLIATCQEIRDHLIQRSQLVPTQFFLEMSIVNSFINQILRLNERPKF